MATTKTKTLPKPRPGPWDDVPPLPPDCEAALSTEQVRLMLGGISERTFFDMMKVGEFPREDFKIRTRLRWSRATVAAWLRAKQEGYRRGVDQQAQGG